MTTTATSSGSAGALCSAFSTTADTFVGETVRCAFGLDFGGVEAHPELGRGRSAEVGFFLLGAPKTVRRGRQSSVLRGARSGRALLRMDAAEGYAKARGAGARKVRQRAEVHGGDC